MTLKGELIEILYEPDIPWFKCLTLGKDKEAVICIIKDFLLELVNSEVASLDSDAPQDVKAPEPRLISWARHQSLENDKYDEFIEYRFPAFMASLPYKEIWRGLEHSGATFDGFLSDFRRLIKSENAPATTADFEICNECHISYNMRNNLVYIGSSTSAAALKKAIEKLETALDLLVSISFLHKGSLRLIQCSQAGLRQRHTPFCLKDQKMCDSHIDGCTGLDCTRRRLLFHVVNLP